MKMRWFYIERQTTESYSNCQKKTYKKVKDIIQQQWSNDHRIYNRRLLIVLTQGMLNSDITFYRQ